MTHANEEDVVIAFRQAVEEELRKVQTGRVEQRGAILTEGISTEDALRRLAERHEELEHEVALLRTIVLRLVSEPVDRNGDVTTA